MKKLSICFTFLISFLVLSACGSDDNKEQSANSKEETTIENEEINQETATKIINGILNTFRDLGNQHNWNNETNPADFDILREQLLKYATEEFTDTELKSIAKEYYCECDAPLFHHPSFDVRFNMIEKTPTKNIVSTIEMFGYANLDAYVIQYTFIHDDHQWKLSGVDSKSYTEELLNLTRDEVERYLESSDMENAEVFDEVNYEGRKLYLIKYVDDDSYSGIFADNSEWLFDVPLELVSEKYRENGLFDIQLNNDSGSIELVNREGKRILLAEDSPSEPMKSPNREKAVYITPILFEAMSDLYIVDLQDGNQRVLVPSTTEEIPKKVIWEDDEHILVIIGYPFGTVAVGGNIYRINVQNNEREALTDYDNRTQITEFFIREDGKLFYEGIRYTDEIMNEYEEYSNVILLKNE